MGTVDIATLKAEIKSALNDNNTTTSTILDLSSGLSQRVKRVATIDPQLIPIQATQMPCLTISLDSKSIEQRTIAKNQVDAKRRASLRFKISGLVWNQNSVSDDPFDDAASNDLELLMENVEFILRNYPTLGGNTNWQFPTDVTYHQASLDEQTHFRVGFLDLEITLFY